MSLEPRLHQRKSLRLKGYNYASPGSYFVTVCTFQRRCILGTVRNAEMVLSDIGRIADADWRAIPDHSPNVILGAFQIMPNHLHAIVTIKDQVPPGSVVPPVSGASRQMYHKREFGRPIAASLSSIVGAYKSGVTVKVQKAGLMNDGSPWQSRFYDHVIRSDVGFFMLEQYIRLNPVMWEYDVDNPNGTSVSMEDFKRILTEKYGITGMALYMIVNSKKMNGVNIV